jgi:hypothetical protein
MILVFGAIITFFFILFYYAEKFNRMEEQKRSKKTEIRISR